MNQAANPRRYTAFISYAHADNREHGRRWAEWVHHSLESYRVPRDLIGRLSREGIPVPRSLFPVFRDEEELAAADNLPARIEEALENSSAVIAICSRRAANSPWVTREIEFYQQLGRSDRIFALIVEGEPFADEPERECFPAPLRRVKSGEAHAELIAADVRPEGAPAQGFTNAAVWRQVMEESSTVAHPRSEWRDRERRYAEQLELARYKLLAGLLGLDLDLLRRRAEAARARRARIAGGIAAIVAIAMAALASFAWYQSRQAARQRVRAEAERDHANAETTRADAARGEAEDLIRWVQSDVRGRLLAAGRADVLTELNDRIATYFHDHPPLKQDPGGWAARADELHRQATAAFEKKAFAEAKRLLQEEAPLLQRVLDLKSDDEATLFAMVNCLELQGVVASASGAPADSIGSFRAALNLLDSKLADALLTVHRRGMLLLELSQALRSSGRETEATEIARQAAEAQDKGFEALDKQLKSSVWSPENTNDDGQAAMQKLPEILQRAQKQTHGLLSNEEFRTLVRDMIALMEQMMTAREKLKARSPDDAGVLQMLVSKSETLGKQALQSGWREEAIRAEKLQLRFSRPLVHANPQQVEVVYAHADRVLEYLGLLCANQIPPPTVPVVTTELSADERNVATSLISEARRWLSGLPESTQQLPAWQSRDKNLGSWSDTISR
jgi:hypothetical protein